MHHVDSCVLAATVISTKSVPAGSPDTVKGNWLHGQMHLPSLFVPRA